MKLEALRVQRLPGISGELSLTEFGADINVITGPNASGKSSLVRALRLLLAPGRGDPPDVLLEADFADGDHYWRVERFGRDTLWYRDGQPCDAPELPDAEALGGYFLAVDELLGLTRVDETFMRRLQQELTGGYDLAALRREGGPAATHPNRDRDAGNRLLQAERELRDAEAGNRELLEQRRRLPALEADIQRAGDALRRVHQYDMALELATARAQTREARLRLERFPQPMPEGIEQADVERLEHALRDAGAAAEQARQQAETAEQGLAETGLEKQAPTGETVAAIRQQLARLRELASRRGQAEEQLAADRRRASEVAGVLGAAPETLPHLTSRDLAELEECVQDLARALAEVHHARAADGTEGTDTVPGRQARGQRWLAAAAAAAGLSGGLLLAVRAWMPPYWLTAAGLTISIAGLAWLVWRVLQPRADDDHAGRAARARRAAAAEAHLEQAREQLRTRAEAVDLAPEPEQFAQHFQLYLHRVDELDKARRAMAETEGRVAHLQTEETEVRNAIRERLAQWTPLPERDDPAELERAVEALDQRRQRAERLSQDIRGYREQQRQAHARARESETRLQALYRQAGLTSDARETLLGRIRELPDWRAARQALQEAETRETAARERLRDADPEILERAEAEDGAWLREQRNHAQAEADRHEALISEKAGIEHALREAERALRLEDARARRDQAEDALRERYEQRMLGEAGRFLLDDVEQAHRRDHQPEAVRLADQRLRGFTYNAFSLVMGDDGAPWAHDSQSGALRPLQALSVGTRMQLLIALRMAWVEQRERHHAALPLVLDEALTTTDPARFDAVATALHAVTRREGRQLIYLTAQPEDVERWRRATGTAPHVIELTSVHGEPAPPDTLALPARHTVPAPGDHDPRSYARALGVPALNPGADPGSIHLFHVLPDDLPLLYRLLSDFRLETVGQADAFLETTAAHQHLDTATRQRLRTRLASARAWSDALHIGRGHPVDRPALEQGPMSNWKNLNALAERAAAVGGDPAAFLDSLRTERISGIGDRKIAQIAEWLEEAGFLDSRERMDATGRYHHVLGRLPDHADAVREARVVVDSLERAAGLDEDGGEPAVIAGW